MISGLAEGRTETPQTRNMLAPTGPVSGRIAIKKGHQVRSKKPRRRTFGIAFGRVAGRRASFSGVVALRCACHARAGLETLGLVHEHEFVIILRAKSAGFSNLRYTRIESISADYSARLANDIDTDGVHVVQQTGMGRLLKEAECPK